MFNQIVVRGGAPSEMVNLGNTQQRLQFTKAADGSVTVHGLFPGQKLFRLPDGRLSIISPNKSKIALQPGVTLVATGASIPPIGGKPKSALIADSYIAVNFAVGDKIRMDPKVAFQRLQTQKLVGSQEAIKKFTEENVGTVVLSSVSKISAKFPYLGSDLLLHFHAPYRKIEKLNVFSVNQLIRIKSDVLTVTQMEMQFQQHSEKLKGAFGRVTGIDEKDPIGNVFIQFDNSDVTNCLPKGTSLPSAWMDPVQSSHAALDKDLMDLTSKGVALFFKTVDEGAFRVAKLLVNRHGVDPESRNGEGKTALHSACLRGHRDLVEWLLDELKVDMEQSDNKGFRAIHYAVLGKNTGILEMLMEREAQVDSRSRCGRTALHIAVMKQSVDCIHPLLNNDADANIQDFDGNTPLHIGILNGAYQCVDAMMPYFSFNWQLRNKDGFNIIHLAVVKNNLKAINFIMGEQNMCDHLLELMPNSISTVLHYSCVNKNYQMAKLLVDGSKGWMLLDGSPLLAKLLEAKHENGATALLIACRNKDYATVELLVESGANVRAVDQDGNTAILLAASSPATEEIPSQELSPAIYKVYQSAVMMDSRETKLVMKNHPILSLIAYLKAKGASSEVKLIQGSSAPIITPPSSVVASSWIKKEIVEEEVCDDFHWVADETKCGHLLDRTGNKYTRTGTRKDGSINFRCVYESSYGRCSALARRSKSEGNGKCWTVKLESGHVHEASGLKRKLNDDGSPGPSLVKKERNNSGKKGK